MDDLYQGAHDEASPWPIEAAGADMHHLHDWRESYAPAPMGGDPHISVIKDAGIEER
jgi:hypothetical protein